MNRINLTKNEADKYQKAICQFVNDHYQQLANMFDCSTADDWPENVIQFLKERNVKPIAQDIITNALTNHFCCNYSCTDAVIDECNRQFNVIADTKTNNITKKDNTMTPNTNTTTQLNVADLIMVKMMEKLMDGDTKELNLGKMTIVQALANGQTVDFGEVMKAKMTEKLLKAVEADEDIPLGKLLMLQAMTTNPKFGINDLVQLKLMEKLLDEPEAKTETKPKTK